ncbi:ATP-binding protein [Amycolatopsis magusensis]|uniref:ATP-binding protein n=1 Tax=Amycolatopsis magusensis TaxID=882444 RepID=UPI00379AA81C
MTVLHRVVSACAAEVTVLRRAITSWARALGLDDDKVQDLALAVHEAMANVVDHAYRGDDGPMEVRAWPHQGSVIVVVSDHGSWRTPTPHAEGYTTRGRGLKLIKTLADEVAVQAGERGTALRMTWSQVGLP